MISLTNVTPINLIKNVNGKKILNKEVNSNEFLYKQSDKESYND